MLCDTGAHGASYIATQAVLLYIYTHTHTHTHTHIYIWGTVVSGMTLYVWWWRPRWSSKRRQTHSARSHHSLFCVSCYQNHHRQNINLYIFRTAQTANLSSQAWQDIGCYNTSRSKNPNLKTGTLVSLQSKILFLGVPSVSSHLKSIPNKGCYY
jgi:hypothetical protein